MTQFLKFEPAKNSPGLLAKPTAEAIMNWAGQTSSEDIEVAEINPEFSDTAEFCEEYGIDPKAAVNCVIAEAVRGENRSLIAVMVPAHCKADLNKKVKKTLDVRRVSFAPMEEVLAATQMEFGGITPIGLPSSYKILIDSRVITDEKIIIGSGLRKSKIYLPGKALAELPNSQVIEDLGIETV